MDGVGWHCPSDLFAGEALFAQSVWRKRETSYHDLRVSELVKAIVNTANGILHGHPKVVLHAFS